jgi:hypothetical protein
MLVVDFMHECELGTWKALFTHLLRLLYALPGGSQLVAKLDTRYAEHCYLSTNRRLICNPTVGFARFRLSVMV